MPELFLLPARAVAREGATMAVEVLTAHLMWRLWTSYARSPQAAAALRP